MANKVTANQPIFFHLNEKECNSFFGNQTHSFLSIFACAYYRLTTSNFCRCDDKLYVRSQCQLLVSVCVLIVESYIKEIKIVAFVLISQLFFFYFVINALCFIQRVFNFFSLLELRRDADNFVPCLDPTTIIRANRVKP